MSVIHKIISGFIFVIVALVLFPVIDTLAVEVFSTLDSSNVFIMVNVLKGIIGMIPFFIAISALWDIFGGNTQPTYPRY